MFRFFVAIVISLGFLTSAVGTIEPAANKFFELWSKPGFWSSLNTIASGFMFLLYILWIAWLPIYLYFDKSAFAKLDDHNFERRNINSVRWLFSITFILVVGGLMFQSGFPQLHHLLVIVFFGIFCISGYWAALKPIDYQLVKTRFFQFSGFGAAVLFILGIGVALFGFTNSPSNYSGRRLIELAAYGSGAMNTLEREFAIASGAVVFGGILVAVAVALVVWLVATRRK